MQTREAVQGCNQICCSCWSSSFGIIFGWEAGRCTPRSSTGSWYCASWVAYCLVISSFYIPFLLFDFPLSTNSNDVMHSDGLQICTCWSVILFTWTWETAATWWGIGKLAWFLSEYSPNANGIVTKYRWDRHLSFFPLSLNFLGFRNQLGE